MFKFYLRLKNYYKRLVCFLNGHDYSYDLDCKISPSQCKNCGKINLDITAQKYNFIDELEKHDKNYL